MWVNFVFINMGLCKSILGLNRSVMTKLLNSCHNWEYLLINIWRFHVGHVKIYLLYMWMGMREALQAAIVVKVQSNTDNTNSFGLKKKFVLTVIWVIDIPLMSINALVNCAKNLCAQFQIYFLVTNDFVLMILTSSVDLKANLEPQVSFLNFTYFFWSLMTITW